MKKDTIAQLSKTTFFLHWLIAITIIGLLASGLYMVEVKDYDMYFWHKSFGIAIFGFVIFRIIWRFANGFPRPLGNQPHYLQLIAKFTHIILLLFTFIMPLSGLIMSSMGGYGLNLFGLELLGQNIISGQIEPINKDISFTAKNIHNIAGIIFIGLIVIHISAALKHHYWDKDDTLNRMLSR